MQLPFTREQFFDLFVSYNGIWLTLVAVESIHGVMRRLFLEPQLGDLRARQVIALLHLAVRASARRSRSLRNFARRTRNSPRPLAAMERGVPCSCSHITDFHLAERL